MKSPIKIFVLFSCLLGVLSGVGQAVGEEIYEFRLPVQGGGEQTLAGTRAQMFGYAKSFTDRGDYTYSRFIYERLIRKDPGDVRAYILLGRLYQDKHEQYIKALKYYKQATQLVSVRHNPEGKALAQRLTAEAYRALAEKTDSLIYFVQAMGEYQKILRYMPNDYESMYYLAFCRVNTQDYGTAIQLYTMILERAPQTEWAELSRDALAFTKKEQTKFERSRRKTLSRRNG